jgi:site-specific DNA recombinase
MAMPVPAILRQEVFEAAQHRLERHGPMARRHNTAHEYLLRGLVRGAPCRLTCPGRPLTPGSHYDVWQGRTASWRAARGRRGTARYAPAPALDKCVWQDLCRVRRAPALIPHALERAQRGAWLPQALPAGRQQVQRLDLYLAEGIESAEFERKRQEVTKIHQSLTPPLRHLDAQAQQHVHVAA